MEINKLYPFILLIVMVSMVIGVGVLTLDKFSTSTYYTLTNYNDSVTLANNTRIALDKGNITSVSAVWNNTNNTFNSICYEVFPINGSITFLNQTASCRWHALGGITAYVIYDYNDYDTATAAATGAVSREIANIASNWLGLIIVITMLSIILFLVIRSFGAGARRE